MFCVHARNVGRIWFLHSNSDRLVTVERGGGLLKGGG